MKAARVELVRRRDVLRQKIADERRMFGATLQVWRQPLAVLDLVRSVARFVRLHPFAVACGLGALRLVVPRPIARLGLWWQSARLLAALFARK